MPEGKPALSNGTLTAVDDILNGISQTSSQKLTAIAQAIKDVGIEALRSSPELILKINGAYATARDLDEFFLPVNRGPSWNYDKDRARRWAQGIVVGPIDTIPVRPTIETPRLVSTAADIIGVSKDAYGVYGDAVSLQNAYASMKQFIFGARTSDRAQGFLNSLKSVPNVEIPAPVTSLIPNDIQVPIIRIREATQIQLTTVNNAVDVLTTAIDEGLNQFLIPLDAYMTGQGDINLGDPEEVLRSMFRQLPEVGRIVRGYEYVSWDNLR